MIRRKIVCRVSPPFSNRGSRSQTLQAILVIETFAGKRILDDIVRQTNMPHLRVHQAMDQSAINDRSSSDASTDGQIDKVLNVLRSAPTPFSNRCRVYISIESNWYV